MRNLFTLTLVVFGLNGCNTGINCIRGSGPVATREIELLSTFDQINFEIAGNVTLIDAPEQKMIIETHQNMINELNTFVNDMFRFDENYTVATQLKSVGLPSVNIYKSICSKCPLQVAH